MLAVAAVHAQTPAGVTKESTTQVRAKHDRKPGHRHHKRHHDRALAHLKLTDEQRKQARSISENYQKQATALKAQDNITMGDYKKQLASLQAGRKQQMDQLLTAEQKQQLAQQRVKGAEHRKAQGEARMAKMKSKLNLTDDQVAKLQQQRNDLKTQLKAIHENQSLDQTAKREQSRALVQKQKDNFKSVLTQEQLDKLHDQHKKGDVK
jgi:Spy/CpxP family protein refolding chaperone